MIKKNLRKKVLFLVFRNYIYYFLQVKNWNFSLSNKNERYFKNKNSYYNRNEYIN